MNMRLSNYSKCYFRAILSSGIIFIILLLLFFKIKIYMIYDTFNDYLV